jgi:2-polyprenyl-3-methyl-5-hydroxy-6-metoxy-1,4-benzoquinol methylase
MKETHLGRETRIKAVQAVPELDSYIKNPEGNGWYFGAGDPEMWKYQKELLVPGGKVLDLGIGDGRSSMFFAMNDMEVHGIDTNRRMTAELDPIIESGVPIKITHGDFTTTPIEKGAYDTVIMGHSLVHADSQESALTALESAVEAVKPEGHVWLRTTGKMSSGYEDLKDQAQFDHQVEQIDEDTFEIPCGCSGEMQREKVLFMDPIQTMAFFTQNGMEIVHSEVLPKQELWQDNVMYGEDVMTPHEVGGTISILAKKQKATDI